MLLTRFGGECVGKCAECPVDFSIQNYTIVTSVCNATNPNITACCDAFVILVCPFASYINDPTTNCNTVMFSYLNMAGHYPEQLFQSCQGDGSGLPCPLVPEPSPNPSSATVDMPWRLPSLVIFFVTLGHLARYSWSGWVGTIPLCILHPALESREGLVPGMSRTVFLRYQEDLC